MNRYKMTLDEAIESAEGRAEKLRNKAEHYEIAEVYAYGYEEGAQEWEQLAEWLKELKQLRKQTEWISVKDRMPEEREWIGTKRFGTTISDEVYVTLENSKGERYTKHLRFQNGKLSPYDQHQVDAFYDGGVPIAWMPLPEYYKEESEE